MAKQEKEQIIRGKSLRPNAGIKAWYVKALLELVQKMCDTCEKRLLNLMRKEREYAQDESPASQRRIELNALSREFEEMFAQKAKEIAESMLVKQNRYATSSVKASVAAFGASTPGFNVQIPLYSKKIREMMKTALYDNVNYIRSIERQYFTQITGAVSRAVLDREGITYLAEELRKYKGITKRRARNIAIDQTHKAYETISFRKMAEAGVREWEWVHGGGTKTVRLNHIRDVKDGGLNHSIHKMGEKAWDKEAWKTKGGGYRGEWIEPGQLPFCACFRRPVIRLGAEA